jgi:Sucrase/ferredoxin-like
MTSVPPLRCAPAAAARGDVLAATATPVTRWLLVEQPGAWGRNATPRSSLAPTIADALLAQVAAQGMRLLMIRRYGRAVPGPRRWAYVDSRPGSEATYWGSVNAAADLLEVALDGSAGTASTAPTYLVCTHGTHDACCAIRGRPVAAALSAHRPAQTWECSHIGGDRFAANLVVLPHGFFYGHLSPANARAAAEAYERGAVVPERLRGRCTFPGPVQAAQHFARLQYGEYRVDALAPTSVAALPAATWQVRLAGSTAELAVTVAAERSAPARLTCAGIRDVVATAYRLVSLSRVAP